MQNTQTIVELIQLALTPVFLLVAIGTIINVVTGRVARVIDRARWYEYEIAHNNLTATEQNKNEINSLNTRMSLANWSINFLTAAAVVVCIDILLLMISGLVSYNLDTVLVVMFMLSISFITGGLIAFLMEVSVATATLRVPKKLSSK